MTLSEIQRLFEEAIRAVDRTTPEGRDALLHLAWSAKGIPELEQVLVQGDIVAPGRLTFRLTAGDPTEGFTKTLKSSGHRRHDRKTFEESIGELLRSLNRAAIYDTWGGSSGNSEWFVETGVSLSEVSPQPPTVFAQTLFALSSSKSPNKALESSELWNRWAGRHLRDAVELAINSRWEFKVSYEDGFGRSISLDMDRAGLERALAFARVIEGRGLISRHYTQA